MLNWKKAAQEYQAAEDSSLVLRHRRHEGNDETEQDNSHQNIREESADDAVK